MYSLQVPVRFRQQCASTKITEFQQTEFNSSFSISCLSKNIDYNLSHSGYVKGRNKYLKHKIMIQLSSNAKLGVLKPCKTKSLSWRHINQTRLHLNTKDISDNFSTKQSGLFVLKNCDYYLHPT